MRGQAEGQAASKTGEAPRRWALADGNGGFAHTLAGYALLSFAFSWALVAVANQSQWLEGILHFSPWHGIGQCLGLATVFLLAKRGNLVRHPALRLAPFVLFGAGIAAIVVAKVAPLGIAADIVMGFGYASSLVAYLSLASTFPVRQTVVIVSCSYVAVLALYPAIEELSVWSGLFYSLLAVAASGLLFWMADGEIAAGPGGRAGGDGHDARDSRDAHDACDSSDFHAARGERGSSPAGSFMSLGELTLLCVVVSLTYGFSTGYLDIGPTSFSLDVGFAVPAVVVLVCMAFFRDAFDYMFLLFGTCALMVLGLMLSAYAGFPGEISKTVICVSLGSLFVFSYSTLGITDCRGLSRPSAYAVMLLAIKVCVAVGKEVGYVLNQTTAGYAANVVLVMMIIAVFGYLAVKLRGKDRKLIVADAPAGGLEDAAQGKGLTEREFAVFRLLLEDASTKEISEALFIAPSTVRAHTSRIYEKFGVHSRAELVEVTTATRAR